MNTLQQILQQLASIDQMERGCLSVIRQTANGPSCNFQRWSKGHHCSEYIPAHQVSCVQENIQAYAHFQTLIDQYVDLITTRSREQRLAEVKKKRAKSTLPSRKKPKSTP